MMVKAKKKEVKRTKTLKTITVKNAEGDPDTTAEILIQNKIDYTPKVSVIIPVYNVEPYLCECLDSVINQTLREIEIICVDDGSTDASLDILKEYATKDNRITIIVQKNLYAGVARNAGLSQAKGEYIHFLDSDDWVDLDTYEKLYKSIKEKKVPVVKFRSYTYDNKKDAIVNSYFTNMGAIKEEKFDSFINLNKDCEDIINVSDAPWSGIYNRQFLVDNKILFDNLLCANDVSFYYRCIAYANNIYLSSERFVYYRINNSKSLIGIRPYHFDCQIKQFFNIERIIRNGSLKSIKIIRTHLIRSIFYRYLSYINNDLLDEKAKDKIKSEIKDFCGHIEITEVTEEYIGYYKDALQPIKVSVIVPVYNAEAYLEECLESLIKQSLKDIEIICVNDGSSDNSLKILEEYKIKDNRIKIINLEKNTGAPGTVKNIGMKCASGNYIGIVDSDDYVDYNYFQELYSLAIKNDADISATKSMVRFSEKTSTNTFINCTLDILVSADQKRELMEKSGSNCNKIYRRSMLTKYDIHCYEKRNIAEDNYFSMLSMVAANKIVLTDKVSYFYRRHENSVTSEKRGKKDFLIFDIYKSIEKQIRNICNRKKINSYLSAIRARELQDFIWFRNDCKEEDIPLFKEELKNRFPMIYSELFCEDTIIISLTSYPARIGTIHIVIESLLNQSLKADKVILWLAPEQFPNKEVDLPQSLLDLREKGLTIGWYKDIRSYKKLIPTLRLYPDDIIVTADDDNVYQKDWLKKLYNNYKKYPTDIQAHRVTKFYYTKDRFYTAAGGNSYYIGANYLNKLVGLGGVLYPPHCFYKDILNEDLIKQLAPTNDDQWFWLQAAMNGVKVRVVDNPIIEAHYVEGTQETGLTNINDHGENLFWKDFNRMIEYYPKVKDILKREHLINSSQHQNDSPYKETLVNWYLKTQHKILNLNNPKTFNEKIQWLKLYNATPIKTLLADKYLVRNWIKEKIGEDYLIPLLGAYDSFEEIDFNKLPNQFVIKCNHGSGYNIIVKDKNILDKEDVKSKLNKWMNENFAFKVGCELHYRDIPHKILIEKYITNDDKNLYDYKFWCFNDEVKYMQFRDDFSANLKMVFYDMNWKKQPFYYDHPLYDKELERPNNFDEMVNIAKKLCQGFAFVCVDLYRLNDGTIKFGEMTFTRSSGSGVWNDEKYNIQMGNLIKLPKKAYNLDTGKYYKIKKPSIMKAYLLFPYYLYKIAKMKREYINQNIEAFSDILRAYRIDVKNTGTKDNSVEISGDNISVSTASWLTDSNGIGKVINCSNRFHTVRIKAINKGVLQFIFRGQYKVINGKRLPLWIDLKSVKINGEEILFAPTAVWHDKPFKYDIPIENEQEITIDIETIYHNFSKDELQVLANTLNIGVNLMSIQSILTNIEEEKHNCELYWKDKICDNILSNLTSYRLDIKNIGSPSNALEIKASNGKIEEPKWFTNNEGIGKMIYGDALNNKIKLKIINDGLLRFNFRSQYTSIKGKCFPVWIDYKSIKIDGKEILLAPIATWHDKPYRYEMSVKDGQEVTIEIEQQYHEYTEDELKDVILKLSYDSEYIQNNIDIIMSELKTKLPIIDKATYEKQQFEKCMKDVMSSLTAYRLDIKNFGDDRNFLEITADNVVVEEPKWFTNIQGIGKILQGNNLSNTIKIKAINDGVLRLDFKGQDKRFNGERIPLWIDYKSIKIDGKEILSEPIETWHDERFKYNIEVKDGQEINLEIEQQYHRYTEDELKDLLFKLYPADEFIRENIDKIISELDASVIRIYKQQIGALPQIEADLFVPLGRACRPAHYLRENNLRFCSLPFDWMMDYPLSVVIETLKNGVDNWCEDYEEFAKRGNERTVKDTRTGMYLLHAFPTSIEVSDYIQTFREIFNKRNIRFKKLLQTSNKVCFIVNRRTSCYIGVNNFLQQILSMFSHLNIVLINVINSEHKYCLYYKFTDKLEYYEIHDNDIYGNGSTNELDSNFWKGNEDLWNEVCSHLSLSDSVKTKLEKENKDKDSVA